MWYTSHLDDLQVGLAPLCGEARHAAELLRLGVGVMHGPPGAADELTRVQRAGHGLHRQGFTQGAAVAGGVHHHGLRARVDLRLHHGDLQDVGHRGFGPRGPGAGLGDQLGRGLCAAEHRRWMVGAAEGDLGDGGALCDDRLLRGKSFNEDKQKNR